MFITVHTHTHTQTEMYKHGVSRLQSKTTRNTRIVEQIQFVICCREGEFVPWKIMSLTKRVLEGRFGGFGIWLGDLGGGSQRKQELLPDWVLLESGAIHDGISQGTLSTGRGSQKEEKAVRSKEVAVTHLG